MFVTMMITHKDDDYNENDNDVEYTDNTHARPVLDQQDSAP